VTVRPFPALANVAFKTPQEKLASVPMEATYRTLLAVVAVAMFLPFAAPVGAKTGHCTGNVEQAVDGSPAAGTDPATVPGETVTIPVPGNPQTVTTSTYYVEARSVGDTNYPLDLYVYQETNGVAGLQRGGFAQYLGGNDPCTDTRGLPDQLIVQ
jgi:hypothetical protein